MNYDEWLEEKINEEAHIFKMAQHSGAVEDEVIASVNMSWLNEIKELLRAASAFTLRQYNGITGECEVKIEKRGKLGWAVLYDTYCVGQDGERVFIEPQPSSRTEEYLRNYRWPLRAALAEAKRLMAEEEQT